VKFLPEWAPVNLALSTGGSAGAGAVDHVGRPGRLAGERRGAPGAREGERAGRARGDASTVATRTRTSSGCGIRRRRVGGVPPQTTDLQDESPRSRARAADGKGTRRAARPRAARRGLTFRKAPVERRPAPRSLTLRGLRGYKEASTSAVTVPPPHREAAHGPGVPHRATDSRERGVPAPPGEHRAYDQELETLKGNAPALGGPRVASQRA